MDKSGEIAEKQIKSWIHRQIFPVHFTCPLAFTLHSSHIMPASSSSKTVAKPYDRPNKGKGKESGSEVNIGAPAQHGQKSRKGKKAWRKNVDISQEETAMEQGREEERTTG